MSATLWELELSTSEKITFLDIGKWIVNGRVLEADGIRNHVVSLEKRTGLFGTVIERFELADHFSKVRFRRCERDGDVWWDVVVPPTEVDGAAC